MITTQTDYFETFHLLRNTYNTSEAEIDIPGSDITLCNIPFRSGAIPTEAEGPAIRFDKKIYNALLKYYLRSNSYSNDYLFQSLNERDENIGENTSFNYIIVKKRSSERSGDFTFLFHGLNERSWDKYLPWAFDLVETTGKPVVLFPLAYHINRAPRIWSDPRLMKEVSQERARLFPDIQFSSFANAALSIRLQFSPNRFVLSGVQTFRDIIRLMESIRTGEHPHLHEDASVDIFGYSIGAFFAELLMMSSPRGMFDKSKMFLFCGGPTLDLMNPVSKAIIDSEAALALKNFYIDTNGSDFLKDDMITSTFAQLEEGGNVFKSMLDHRKMESFRTARFESFGDRCLIVPLEKDTVMPPDAVYKTFHPNFHKNIQTEDFSYTYLHENPFPLNVRLKEEVNTSFRRIFDIAGGFLS